MSISLNNHEERIKNAELELPKIQSRIDNLVASGKDWAIYSVKYGSTTTVDSKFTSCNMCVINCNLEGTKPDYSDSGKDSITRVNLSSSGSRVNIYPYITHYTVSATWQINKSGVQLSIGINDGNFRIDRYKSNATVLLYK